MHSFGRLAFLAGLTVYFVACSNPFDDSLLVGERGSSSCDLRNAERPEQRCTDASSVGVGQTSFKATCDGLKGATGDRCAREGTLGGCNVKNTDRQDNDITSWYFPSDDVKSVEDVRTLCEQKGETFVAP